MPAPIDLMISDMFLFSDGRTVFLGAYTKNPASIKVPCKANLLVDGEVRAELTLYLEILEAEQPPEHVSTLEEVPLDRTTIQTSDCRLRLLV